MAGNDTSLGYQRVSQRCLAVVDMSDDRHVTDLIRIIHDISDLLESEVGHTSNRLKAIFRLGLVKR